MGETSGKPGPDRWEPDLEELKRLCRLCVTNQEIAAYFGVSENLIYKEMNRNPQFRRVVEEGRSMGKLAIRRKQMEVALSGDKTMLIWLGKCLLGQRAEERSESIEQNPLKALKSRHRKVIEIENE